MASESETSKPRSRRDLLLGLGTVALVAGGWQLWARRPRGFDFASIDGLPGWRQIAFDGVSPGGGDLGSAALVGIGATAPEVAPLAAGALCETLFRERPPGKVPVAAFSDFFCPFCRVLTDRLAMRAARPESGIALTWHELPLLGPVSVFAARAALAADRQGAYGAFQRRLMTTPFRPTPTYLRETAEMLALDADRLLADMESPGVAEQLDRSRAASLTLGVWGTPALVVGRTLVLGEIGEAALDRLIAIEAEAGPLPC